MANKVAPMTSDPLHAPIKWAQRSDRILLTVDIRDVRDVNVQFTDTSMKFRGFCENETYASELEFFNPIDPKASSYKVFHRSVQINIVKKQRSEEDDVEKTKEYWPRLLKDKQMESNKYELTSDWDHWIDQDEEDSSNAHGFNWTQWNL